MVALSDSWNLSIEPLSKLSFSSDHLSFEELNCFFLFTVKQSSKLVKLLSSEVVHNPWFVMRWEKTKKNFQELCTFL